jgi:hypothetical protein
MGKYNDLAGGGVKMAGITGLERKKYNDLAVWVLLGMDYQ